MKQGLFIILFILLSKINYSQDKVFFHEYTPTASSWNVIEWNIQDTANVIWAIKETVDPEGRVTELQFLKKGSLISNYLCYLPNRVTYEYIEGQIIETLFSFDQPLTATDCEMNFKAVYHLDNENYINKIEYFSKYDFSGLDSAEIIQWKIWVPEYSFITPDSAQLQVAYYYHSYAKMRGLFPVSRNFKLVEDYYYGDEPEKTSIKNGIKKYKN